jgi:hypothetical protein
MFLLKSVAVVVAVSTAAVARPASHINFAKSVAEEIASPPVGWTEDAAEKVDKDATSITLKIHLVNQDMDSFHKHAMNVSERIAQSKDAGYKLILHGRLQPPVTLDMDNTCRTTRSWQ